MSIRLPGLICFTAAILFLNLDGYQLGVAPSLNSGPRIFGEPLGSNQVERTLAISRAFEPYIGTDLAAVTSIGWMHGWPVMFAYRDATLTSSKPGNLSSRWPFDDAASPFPLNWRWMLFDIVFFFIIAIAFFWALPSSRTIRLSISLRVLLAATALVAIGLWTELFYTRLFPQLIAFIVVLSVITFTLIVLTARVFQYAFYRSTKSEIAG